MTAPPIRWSLVERLARAYHLMIYDDPALGEASTLTDDERQVLQWKFEESDGAFQHLVAAMKDQGAGTVADLKP